MGGEFDKRESERFEDAEGASATTPRAGDAPSGTAPDHAGQAVSGSAPSDPDAPSQHASVLRGTGSDDTASAPAHVLGSPPAARAVDEFGVPEEMPEWTIRARRKLDEEYILEEVTPGSLEAARVMSLHKTMQTRSRLYAHHLRQLATFFVEDPEVRGLLDDADISALKIAAGLRCSYGQAQAQVRDAYLAAKVMPLTFEYLRRGELPEAWHHTLVRHARRLTEDQARQVDTHMAAVELPSISKRTFDKQVLLAVRLATAGTLPTPPSSSRNVEVVDMNTETGTASLLVTGPIPEIQALAHRLDVASRTVQKAQRAALEDGAEGPLPFDIDRDLRDRGKALSLKTLRYAILTHSILDTDPVEETASQYKILVTVPVTTMLGMDNAPAMLEGMTPIPAEQARMLAAGEKTWQRILTDPLTGAYLPVTATTYQPTTQMRLQLRLRHPVCAVPGCARPTAMAAEDDHIIEYDHDHPDQGGQTSLWNLHRLCWLHHKLKTAGLLDPERDPDDDPSTGDGTTTAGPLSTTWTIGNEIRTRTRENTDLLTPHTVAALELAWRVHQRVYDDAARLHAEEKARPHTERAAEQRQHAHAKARPGRTGHLGRTDCTDRTGRFPRRIIPPGPTLAETTPPF